MHTDPAAAEKLNKKKPGIKKKYPALSVINQIMGRLMGTLPNILPTAVTIGYETKKIRESMGLEKDHYIDAWCIAVSALSGYEAPDFTDSVHNIKQFRRHDRANIKSQRERSYYLDGKLVAKNRTPRFEQQGPALSDLNLTEAEVSRLTVKKSTRYYNDKNRLMPGALVECEGKVFVLSGQLTGGKYYRAVGDNKTNYPSAKCRILQENTGLVFVLRKIASLRQQFIPALRYA